METQKLTAEGSDRKSREYAMGASNVTAMKESSWTEARTRLMEEVVDRSTRLDKELENEVMPSAGMPTTVTFMCGVGDPPSG